MQTLNNLMHLHKTQISNNNKIRHKEMQMFNNLMLNHKEIKFSNKETLANNQIFHNKETHFLHKIQAQLQIIISP